MSGAWASVFVGSTLLIAIIVLVGFIGQMTLGFARESLQREGWSGFTITGFVLFGTMVLWTAVTLIWIGVRIALTALT